MKYSSSKSFLRKVIRIVKGTDKVGFVTTEVKLINNIIISGIIETGFWYANNIDGRISEEDIEKVIFWESLTDGKV